MSYENMVVQWKENDEGRSGFLLDLHTVYIQDNSYTENQTYIAIDREIITYAIIYNVHTEKIIRKDIDELTRVYFDEDE